MPKIGKDVRSAGYYILSGVLLWPALAINNTVHGYPLE